MTAACAKAGELKLPGLSCAGTAPVVNGNTYTVTVQLTGQQRYFRLVRS